MLTGLTAGITLAALVSGSGIADADTTSIDSIVSTEDTIPLADRILNAYNQAKAKILDAYTTGAAKIAEETLTYAEAFIKKAEELHCIDPVTHSPIPFEELNNTGDHYESFELTLGDVKIDGIPVLEKDENGEVIGIKAIINPRPPGYTETQEEIDERAICDIAGISYVVIPNARYDADVSTILEDVKKVAEELGWAYDTPTAVDQDNLPEKSKKRPVNYPNPFNPTTTIRYYVPEGLNGQEVYIIIYNILGQKGENRRYNVDSRPGINEATLNLTGLTSGVHLYGIFSGNKLIGSNQFTLAK